MVPEELSRIFELYDYEDLNLGITNVILDSDILTVEFDIQSIGIGDLESLDSKWILTATGYKDSHIAFDYAARIVINDDHPLLWKYLDVQCELYFNGYCQDIGKFFVDIYDIHFELFKNLTPMESFLNARHIYELMQARNGLLAKGPKKLLTRYAECLKIYGVDFSIIGERFPTYWNGKSFIPENKNLNILLFNATRTYIVAESFVFEKQDATKL